MRWISALTALLAVPFALTAPIVKRAEVDDTLILRMFKFVLFGLTLADQLPPLEFLQAMEQMEREFYWQVQTKFQDQDYIKAGFVDAKAPKRLLL